MRKNKTALEDELDIIEIPAIADMTISRADDEIPDSVIRRLPRYFRCLRELLNRDVMKISSNELSELTGVSASQLRQDLKYFGGLGQRGYGYNVKRLYSGISERLGVGKKYTAVIIGAGNLGKALSNSRLFEQRGVWVKGVFDVSDNVIGDTLGENTVKNVSELKDFCKSSGIDIAVLCIPCADQTELIKLIGDCGFKGVWNFSPCEINERLIDIPVVNLCTADSLMYLTYEISCRLDKDNENKS